jgi:predicted PurR-regulated permease PerM
VKLNTKFILAFLGLLIIMIALFFVLFPYNLIILYFESNTIKCFILLSVIIIIMAGIVTYFSSRVTKSIKKIDETVKILLNDETENIKKFLPTGKDEIAKLSESLNQHHKNIRLVYNIAYTIVKGKYNTQITTDPNNVLGNVLSELKEKLMTAKQERKYVEQESIRTEWYRQGISDFSDLLQLNYQDAQLLA